MDGGHRDRKFGALTRYLHSVGAFGDWRWLWMCSHKIAIRPWVVQQLLTTDDDQFVFSHYLIIFVFGFVVVVWSVNSRARQRALLCGVVVGGHWSRAVLHRSAAAFGLTTASTYTAEATTITTGNDNIPEKNTRNTPRP